MQCLTDLIFLLVAVESIFKDPHSTLLDHDLRQSLESGYPASSFLPPCRIQNLETPHCLMSGSVPKLNVSSFMISPTLLCKSSSMLGGLR